MSALSFLATYSLSEFRAYAPQASGNTFRLWYLILNNFHFNLPHYSSIGLIGVTSENRPGYYRELSNLLENLDTPNHIRFDDDILKVDMSAQFLAHTPRSFYQVIDETIEELRVAERIKHAVTIRMFGKWEENMCLITSIGMLYTALRFKGFTRADLVT